MSDAKVEESFLMKVLPQERLMEILGEFKRQLDDFYGDRFVALYLYGSYARGTPTVDSDIDVLLVLSECDNPYNEISEFIDIQCESNLKYDFL